MATVFRITSEAARKIEAMAFAAENQQVHLGDQDENGTISLAFIPGYRQPDTDRILGHRLPTADNGWHYREVDPDGSERDVTGQRGGLAAS